MNKAIFLGLTLAPLTAIPVVSPSGLQEAYSTAFGDLTRDRANNNLDKHIDAGGEHGKKAQEKTID